MASLLDSTQNTRCILPNDFRYIQGFLDWLKQSNFLEGVSSNEAL